ncbi:MAG: hypothetical protein Q7K54_05680 [Candidatus Parcubacteria bacterium]|nr:hypothetical protein [Candidatus Parcubacteria bacterium]
MKTNLSENIQRDIKKVIEIILREIELGNNYLRKNLVLVYILNKKFEYPEDLGRIINKINEEEKCRILRILSKTTVDNSFPDDKITEEGFTSLLRARDAFDLGIGLEQAGSFYFFIEDIKRLRAIYKKLNDEEQTEKNKDNELFIFTITKGGSLNRKDKIDGDKPYKMEVGKLRHNCLLELIKAQSKSNNFYLTNELANVLDTTEGKIRDAVAGIKIQLVKSFKGIRRNDFIESAKNSGYRLHKQIRIIKV